MTTFWGYLLEGSILAVLCVWYAINTFARVIKCQASGAEFTPKLSYPCPGTRIPVEIFFKFVCSFIGFILTLTDEGLSWTDDDGNFRKMETVMYMSIYGIFLVHSVLELLLWLGIPVVRDADYVTGALGFFLYAIEMFYRSRDFTLQGWKVAAKVHTFTVYPLLGLGVTLLVEVAHKTEFWVQLVRIFCLGLLASWDWNAAVIMHSHHDFPGRGASDWSMTNHDNAMFLGAAFGYHLVINLVFLAVLYGVIAACLRARNGIAAKS